MHVAVDDPDKAINVVNGLLVDLPLLLGLSASSPFWRGEPTGCLRASRSSRPSPVPVLRPRFRDYAEYAEVIGHLEHTGCIADYTHIWWDIRPHPKLGTIEIRICDSVTRVEDAIAIAAFYQALVKHYSELHEETGEVPNFHRILTTENKWLSIRYGLDAPIMDLATGRRNRISVAQLVRRRLRELEPHARELGSERELEESPTSSGAGTRRPPTARLQREPRHRRGGPRDRGRHRSRRGLGPAGLEELAREPLDDGGEVELLVELGFITTTWPSLVA